MNKKLEEMSIMELKAISWDIGVKLNQHQQDIQIVNKLIIQKMQEQKPIPTQPVIPKEQDKNVKT